MPCRGPTVAVNLGPAFVHGFFDFEVRKMNCQAWPRSARNMSPVQPQTIESLNIRRLPRAIVKPYGRSREVIRGVR